MSHEIRHLIDSIYDQQKETIYDPVNEKLSKRYNEKALA